jgi:hypothetical protein
VGIKQILQEKFAEVSHRRGARTCERVSAFGFRLSGFGFRVSAFGFGFRVRHGIRLALKRATAVTHPEYRHAKAKGCREFASDGRNPRHLQLERGWAVMSGGGLRMAARFRFCGRNSGEIV